MTDLTNSKDAQNVGGNQVDNRLVHQVEAFYWMLGQCSDDFVRAWLAQKMELVIRGGGTPESVSNTELAEYKIGEVSGLVPPDSDTKPDSSKKPKGAQKGTL